MPVGEDSDEDGHFEFLEQHCWYDLDGDGYKEPYIVTVLKDTSEVARIIARFDEDGIYLNSKGEISKIVPVEYFTKFAFMPNPDGGSYDVGLGMLLNPINETVNTVLNQLLDAGTLANTGGGFLGNGLKMKGGPARFVPGEFKPVDTSGGKISDNIYHMQFPGPNAVLFNLLGMLIEAGKDISSVKDILTGDQQVNQTATTTLALIEQGQKVFSAIYKRVHRSLKQEFKKLYRLNKLYLQPEDYYRFQDKVEPIYLEDYQGDDTDVAPVSDPTLVSDAQELTRAEALMKFVGDPLFDQMELRRKYLKALKEQDIDILLVKEPPQSPEDPQLLKIKADIEAQKVTITAQTERMVAEMDQIAAKVAETEASTILKLAQAEAIELGPQMDIYMSQFQAMLDRHTNALQAQQEIGNDEQGAVPAVGEPPVDTGVPQLSESISIGPDGAMGGGGDSEPAGPIDGDGAMPNG
jgi:chaperonin GroES